jgi:hypothetical protein
MKRTLALFAVASLIAFSGISDTVIDTSAAGNATGTAKSSGNDRETKIDVSFHARK